MTMQRRSKGPRSDWMVDDGKPALRHVRFKAPFDPKASEVKGFNMVFWFFSDRFHVSSVCSFRNSPRAHIFASPKLVDMVFFALLVLCFMA